jgi:hypothetical protein
MEKWEKIDKNIIIHGAGLSKPGNNFSGDFGSHNNNSNNGSNGANPSSSMMISSAGTTGVNNGNNARSNVISSLESDNLEDFTEYRGGSINERGYDATADEINIISNNNSANKMYHYSTFNYYNNHTLYHHGFAGSGLNPGSYSSSHQPLPRIENSFSTTRNNNSKVIFIILISYS